MKALLSSGEPRQFQQSQKKKPPAFYFNRPPKAATTVPITLYEAAFAQFQEDCETYEPTSDDNQFVLEFLHMMSKFYSDEAVQASKVRELLENYGLHFPAAMIRGYGKFITDGHGQDGSYGLMELKNEMSGGGAEPLFQAGWYYAIMTRQEVLENDRFHFPCFAFTWLVCFVPINIKFQHANLLGYRRPCWVRRDDVDRCASHRNSRSHASALLSLHRHCNACKSSTLFRCCQESCIKAKGVLLGRTISCIETTSSGKTETPNGRQLLEI